MSLADLAELSPTSRVQAVAPFSLREAPPILFSPFFSPDRPH